jgi:enoyl-CoA hydratase/carnithine racemase
LKGLESYGFHFILWEIEDHVLSLTLNRPDKRNALHPKMVHEIALLLEYAGISPDIWAIVIKANGPIFCAGADLKAMAGFIEPHTSTIPDPESDILLGDLLNQVHKPIVACVTGDVYAGGFFFLAGSSIVLANTGLKFGLPEVKRGLYPFQVMAALLNVMQPRRVLDWCIRGYNLPVKKAEEYGLVTKVISPEEMDQEVQAILEEIRGNSPSAIRLGMQAYARMQERETDHQYLYQLLQQAIASQDGQEGLRAFREKRKPKWTGT